MKLKRIIAALTAVIMALSAVTACSSSEVKTDGDTTTTTEAAGTAGEIEPLAVPEDLNTTVAGVEGAENPDYFNISFSDFYNEYLFYLNRQGLDETSSTDASTCAGYRSEIINYQTLERVILKVAEEYGIGKDTLTQEELDTINSNVQDSYKSWCTSYETEATAALGETYTDEELYNKEYELFTAFLATCNLKPEIFITWQTNSTIQNKLYNLIIADAAVTDEEATEFLNSKIAEAKDAWDNDLSAFENGYTAFFVPENTRVVEQIYFAFPDDKISEITAYRSDGDDASADQIVSDCNAAIQAEIDAAAKALGEGGDWDTVQATYNDDTNGNDQTYVVYPKSTTVSELIINAAQAIAEVGGYSEPVYTDYGAYLFKYTETAVMSDADMTDLTSQAKEYLLNQKQSQIVSDKVKEWQEKYSYTINYDLIGVTTTAETTVAEATTADETTTAAE